MGYKIVFRTPYPLRSYSGMAGASEMRCTVVPLALVYVVYNDNIYICSPCSELVWLLLLLTAIDPSCLDRADVKLDLT